MNFKEALWEKELSQTPPNVQIHFSGSILHSMSHLEKDSTSRLSNKDAKKSKVSKLPQSSQLTILYASYIKQSIKHTIVNPEFTKILEQTSISRTRKLHINQVMASFRYSIDVCSIIVASITTGNLIWTRSSQTPEEFTIFRMGNPSSISSIMSQKDWLKIHIQEINQIKASTTILLTNYRNSNVITPAAYPPFATISTT